MRVAAMLLAAAAASSCDDGMRPIVDPMGTEALLTIVATPLPGTTATAVSTIRCPLFLEVNPTSGGTVNGSFARSACTGLSNPTSDTNGGFVGTKAADGTASLTFFPAPLPSSAAITTSGGCPTNELAAGPYEGRMADSVLDLRVRFRLGCAGLPSPAPPAFDVEYRITRR